MTFGSRAALAVALLGAPGAAWAQNFGTNGSSCAHTTLAAAITAAGAGGTVYVKNGSYVYGSAFSITSDVTIEGAGNSCQVGGTGVTLTRSGSGRLFEVSNGAELTLAHLTAAGGSSTTTGGTILLSGGADLVLDSATVSGGHAAWDGGCISAGSGSTVTLDSASVVENCDADGNGGNIALASGASLSMANGSMLRGGDAAYYGGNLSIDGTASASVSGDVLEGTATSGGGIALTSFSAGTSPSLVLLGEVYSNDASSDGGGIWVHWIASNALVDVRSTAEVWDNEATVHGGGIFLSTGDLEFSGSSMYGIPQIVGNEALTGRGGGIYVSNGTVTGGRVDITFNTAALSGGGAFAHDSTVDLENALFENNNADLGGAIHMDEGDLTLDTDFTGCTPSQNPFTLGWTYCSVLEDNTATDSGGAIALTDGATADIDNTVFYLNDASATGAGAMLLQDHGTTAVLRNVLLRDNTGDAAVLVEGGDFDVFASTFFSNDAPIVWSAGTTGTISRNVFYQNTAPIGLIAGITGDGNLVETTAEQPTGGNNDVGSANLDPRGHPTATSTLVIDAVTTGPSADLLGRTRPRGAAFDRGAIEF